MAEFLATTCSGLFAGAALYVSLVQHPAALTAGPAVAAALFGPMYRRAAPMQAGLALVGSLAGFLAWLTGSSFPWLVAALLLGSVIPFTILRIKPINDQLLAADFEPESPEAPELLRRWARLHGVRSASSAVAFLVFAFA